MKSDFNSSELVIEGSFQIIKNIDAYVPKRKKTVRSKRGQGNDFQQCNIIDNEYIYCPQSGRCLIDCLTKDVKDFDLSTLDPLLKKKRIYRYNIPQCNVRSFAN
jgi:hypothetical protein